MRNAIGSLTIALSLALLSGRTLQAQSVTRDGGTATYSVSAVVGRIVRVVTTPADPARGLPPTAKVITNDPVLRASIESGIRPEILGPEAIASFGAGHRGGGAEAHSTGELAGPVTIRYTVAAP